MNTWIEMINMYKNYGILPQGIDIKDRVMIFNGSVKNISHTINIYDDRLYEHSLINKVVSNFNISDYTELGFNLEGQIVFSQENSHDIKIENMYLSGTPFQVYYFIENRIYIPNILYNKCCVTMKKDALYIEMDYLDCIIKEV